MDHIGSLCSRTRRLSHLCSRYRLSLCFVRDHLRRWTVSHKDIKEEIKTAESAGHEDLIRNAVSKSSYRGLSTCFEPTRLGEDSLDRINDAS